MSSENKTPNIGLNQWQGHEYVRREDFISDNLIIDREIKDLQDEKADKVSGKGLSTNDYTNEEKNKLSSLEEEIKAPAYTPPIHNYSNIFSSGKGYADNGSELDYSESVVNGQVSVELKGLTLVNSIKNRDFSDGTSGWNSYDSTMTVQNNILKADGMGTQTLGRIYVSQTFPTHLIGDRFFFYTRLKSENNDCNISIETRSVIPHGLVGVSIAGNLVSNVWKEFYGLNTVNTVESIVAIRATYTNKTIQGQSNLYIDGNAGVFAINMTQLGIEDYTEEQMLNLVRNGYFEGVNSTVLAQRIKSTGKNLFDKTKATNDSYVNSIGTLSSSTGYVASEYIAVKNIQSITLNPSWGTLPGTAFYDVNKTFISYVSNGNLGRDKRFIIPNNAMYVRTSVRKYSIDTTQLEEGTTATPYEPYREDKTYISCTDDDGDIEELRSLPNGIKDEVKEGKLYKRTKKYVLKENDIKIIDTKNNATFALISKPVDSFFYNFTTDWRNNSAILGSYAKGTVQEWNNDTVENVGKVFFGVGSITIHVGFPKGTTLLEMQAALVGTTLIYQLATPIVTPIKNINPLKFWKNGTIEISPYLRKSIKYTNGKLTFPIAVDSIDKIVDRNNFEILQSNINLSNDGLSATITNATEAEVYTVYAPIKPELSTIPQTVMSFPCNTKAQINQFSS